MTFWNDFFQYLIGVSALIIATISLLKQFKWRIIFFKYRLKKKLKKYKRNRNKKSKRKQTKAILRMIRFFRKSLRHPETLHNNNFMCESDHKNRIAPEIDGFYNSRFRIGVYKPMGFYIEVRKEKFAYAHNSEENNNRYVIDEFIESL